MSDMYYVLSNDGSEAMPSIAKHDDIYSAIAEMDEWINNFETPVLLREIDANVELNQRQRAMEPQAVPAEIVTIIRKWRALVEGHAYSMIQVERERAFVGRVWLREVERIDAWLAGLKGESGAKD